MAKCPICNMRKGKRKCVAEAALVCSLCCGQSRGGAKCDGCSYFKDASSKRHYHKIPRYSTQEMSDSDRLQDISNVIESIFCKFDIELANAFYDRTALKLLELAFDKYHFNDTQLSFSDVAQESLFETMIEIIEKEVADTATEQLVKVMAAVYRSIQRRTGGRREYLAFVQEYVGARIGPGLRLLRH